jgi:hypothetical protein
VKSSQQVKHGTEYTVMNNNLLQTYSFLFIRRNAHDPKGARSKLPIYVIANKNPAPEHYIRHRPSSFEGFMDAPDITYNTKSLTEARWAQVIMKFIKEDLTLHEKPHESEIDYWENKIKEFEATGVYTYLELMR